ncbi:hypothetical protein [Microviridae sp.]|nr:hypothetical protein [Microviridae sp.]
MKGKQSFEMIAGTHRISTATTHPILLSVNEEPNTVVPVGDKVTVIRLDKPCTVQLDPSEPKKEYKFDVKSWPTDLRSESIDNRPIPNPPAPNNFLKALRAQVRQSMGLTREDFADRSSLYEVNDRDFDEVPFEETETREQAAAIKAAQEEQVNHQEEQQELPEMAEENTEETK